MGNPRVAARFNASHHSPDDDEPSPIHARWNRSSFFFQAESAIPVRVTEAIGSGAVGGRTPL